MKTSLWRTAAALASLLTMALASGCITHPPGTSTSKTADHSKDFSKEGIHRVGISHPPGGPGSN